jgi:hypothetical protein
MKYFNISNTYMVEYVAKHGPAKGIIISFVRQLIAISMGYGRIGTARITGKYLSENIGIPARTITGAIRQLIEDGVLIQIGEVSKKGGTTVQLCKEYMPEPSDIDIDEAKKTPKTPEEKEIIAMAHALYKKRVDFNPKFAGNKFDFVAHMRKMDLRTAEEFSLAVDNWIENAVENNETSLTGINNFLKNGEWISWRFKISQKKLEELKEAIPLTSGNQYDTRSDEYKEYRRILDLKNSEEN